MGLGLGTRRGVALGLLATGLAVGSSVHSVAQTSLTLMEPGAPLLPAKFGDWTRTATLGATPAYSLEGVSKDALAECGQQRSKTAEYARGGRMVHVEAIQFGDRTGAYSAFTLVDRPGMRVGKELGIEDAVGDGAVLFVVGKSVVLANFGGGVTAADVAALKPLAEVMPKVFGNLGMAPVLPTLAPATGLVEGGLRYALGPVSYAAEGGVLPAGSLGWKMEAEAVTAQYDDARGKETLTLLVYPTPTIAENLAMVVRDEVPQLKGPNTKLRREGALVLLATGSFAPDEAERMIAGIHLSQLAFNQDVHPSFKVVAAQTFTLLQNIAILSGVLGAGAVLLGLFLGFGRAWFRVLRGKPAAVEVEFLSLHLAPQNKPAQFRRPDSTEDF
jgi:hypothetical protein